MSRVPVILPSAIDDPDPARRAKLQAAASILTEVLASRPRFRGITIHAFMKGMPGRIVAEATLGEQRCFVKLLIGRHAEMAVSEARAELRFAEANMAESSTLRVARLLHAAPRLGLILLEAAPGERMDNAIESADGQRRQTLHKRGGEWLAWYCAPRRETRAFDDSRFLAHHERLARPPEYVGSVTPEDRKRLAALADYIPTRARRLRGQPVSIAASHGDFLPRNAHVSDATVTAYDIEGLRRVPVASDVARFLVHQQMRQGTKDGAELICGLTAADWTAFLESGVLDAEEERSMMSLYVAQQMQIELPLTAFRPNWQRRLRRAIDAFLRGPGGLSVWLAQIGLVVPSLI